MPLIAINVILLFANVIALWLHIYFFVNNENLEKIFHITFGMLEESFQRIWPTLQKGFPPLLLECNSTLTHFFLCGTNSLLHSCFCIFSLQSSLQHLMIKF